jgi:hypothetical protein
MVNCTAQRGVISDEMLLSDKEEFAAKMEQKQLLFITINRGYFW